MDRVTIDVDECELEILRVAADCGSGIRFRGDNKKKTSQIWLELNQTGNYNKLDSDLLSGGMYYERSKSKKCCACQLCGPDVRELRFGSGLAAVARTQSGWDSERIHRTGAMAGRVDAEVDSNDGRHCVTLCNNTHKCRYCILPGSLCMFRKGAFMCRLRIFVTVHRKFISLSRVGLLFAFVEVWPIRTLSLNLC